MNENIVILSAKIYVILSAIFYVFYYTSYNEMKRLNKKPNYMTVTAALKELEKIEMTRQTDSVYRLDHAVTAVQKKILNAFDLTEKNIECRAAWISEELKTIMKKEGKKNGER